MRAPGAPRPTREQLEALIEMVRRHLGVEKPTPLQPPRGMGPNREATHPNS